MPKKGKRNKKKLKKKILQNNGESLSGAWASFTSSGKISARREAPDVATFDESIAEGAMDEEKGATDGRLAAGRKLAEEVNEAQQSYLLLFACGKKLTVKGRDE